MISYYKLRVDVLDTVDKVCYRNLEKNYFSSYVRSFEHIDEENQHYHYYVETTCSAVSIRQYIRKYIGKGNGVYSLKELDEARPMEYLSYILKDDTNAVWCNLPMELKDEAEAYSKQVKNEIKEKKKRKQGRLELLLEYMEGCEKDKNKVAKEVYYYFKNKGMAPSSHLVQNYTWAVCLHYGIVSWNEYAESQLKFL